MNHQCIMAVLVVLVLCAAAGAAPGEQPWKFHSDLANSGVYDDGGIRPDGTLLWTYMTGGKVRSCPAVVDGVVYVGSRDHTLSALSADTGALLWNVTVGGGIESGPAVAGGLVYTGSADGSVYAFNASDGSQAWTCTTGGAVRSGPAVAGGLVYTGSNDGKVYALDAETGEPAWQFAAGDPQIASSAAVAGGAVYIGGSSGNVYALDALSGALLWNYTTSGPVQSSPAVVDGVVYVGSDDGTVYALSAPDGALLWNFTTGGAVRSGPAVAGGVVYVGSDDGRLYALDAHTGNPVWSYQAGSGISASPAVAGGVVYAGTSGSPGTFFALDASTGDLLWDHSFGKHPCSGSPAVAHGIVYAGCDDGGLYAFGSSGESPPAGVTGLHAAAATNDSITWAWTDPATGGFASVRVFLDGEFREDVPAGTGTWTATGLLPETPHTIGTRTVSASGRVNATWVNHTAWTAPEAGQKAWKFRSDPGNTGAYDDGGTRPGNSLIWKSPIENYYGSLPAVVDGVVYVNGIYEMNALDALTGKLLWSSPHGGGMSSPAVVDGVVYTGSSDRTICALNATTGALLWQYTTEKTVYSSPAVAGGIVYTGGTDEKLYALDAGTGALLWTFDAGAEIRSSPAVARGAVYITGRDGTLSALNATTGALLWSFATGADLVSSSPVVFGNTACFRAAEGNLYALDATTGDLLWTAPASPAEESGPAVAGGMVYTGDGNGTVSALDAADGSPIWTYTAGAPVRHGPSVANGIVYAGSTDGTIHALDAATGDLLWTWATAEGGYTSPVVAGGVLYTTGSGGTLYALATLPDGPPPCVADLHPVTVNGAEITWAWTDPRAIGFSHVRIFLNGVFQENVTAGTGTWTARGLSPSTAYTIGVQTVDTAGRVNQTVVTSTATTGPLSVTHLDPSGAVEGSPSFVLHVYGTGFSPSSVVSFDGVELVTHFENATHISVSVPPGFVGRPRRASITVTDPATGQASQTVVFPVTDNPTARAREFRSDPANTGIYDDGGRRPVPSLLWMCQTGARVTSSPSVAGGIVYIGSQDRNLYALNATTGEILWKYDTMERNDIVSSSPAVANGVVYIGGLKTKVHAVDAYSGDLLWKYKVPIRTTSRSGISSSPTVTGGTIFIANMDGVVYAFDEETGTLLWNYTVPQATGGERGIYASPAVADGAVYVLTYDGDLYVLDASTGTLLWSYETAGDYGAYASPAVSGGVVYTGSGLNGPFRALDARTGALLWEAPSVVSAYSSPAVAHGVVYTGSMDNSIYALDASDGTILWNFTTGDKVYSSPAVAHGVVYAGSNDCNLYALDASDGRLLWNFTVNDGIISSPAVAGGIVYFGCNDGRVYALGTLPVEPPFADYSANITDGKAPLDVLFTDTSIGIVTWRFWDFGDGTTAWANGTQSVVHTYAFPGNFLVSLTAGNDGGQDTRKKTPLIHVTPSGQRPVAWFTALPMVGYRPLQVRFTDRSMGSPVVWRWDFGDGNSSAEKNPVHTYTAAGTFRVSLTVLSAGGRSSSSSTVWVRERAPIPTITPAPTFSPHPTISPGPTIPPRPGAPPVAFFKMSPIMGSAPLAVAFTDLSFNAPTSWSWDFGDGTQSAERNPVHTFTEKGVYTVTLSVENAYGNSSTYRNVYVR
ncbi:MAG TPA: PQQ-binding-like beta-propeller repeat protein [Methanolinea sp.]|nr:PQQ-binding-like beta-propeller repeat protein [Methanolinea sp.]